MSTEVEVNGMVSKEEYGKSKVLGLDVQFSKMLGDVIVENYLKSISEGDMKLIEDYITKDLFEEVRDWKSEDSEAKIKRVKDNWIDDSDRWDKSEVKSVGGQIKEMFNERVKKDLQNKIEEIVKTQDYKDKIEMMAQDIVDYVVEGYKEDLKQSIREKMIGNVLDNHISYGGMDFTQAVASIVQSYIPKIY